MIETVRILQHDLVGYAFTVDLARELARRGHEVDYVYCASITTNPRGPTEPRPDDPPTLRIHPVSLSAPVDKQSLVRRFRQEREYGRRLARLVSEIEPDVVLSSNAPLDAQAPLLAAAERAGIPFVYWLQDLIGEATDRLLRQKLPVAGALIGRHYRRVEADLLRRSSAVIAIDAAFQPYLDGAGVTRPVAVVENWAPIAEIPVRPKQNAWSIAHGLEDTFVFLYSGTLGRKHNPTRLVELAEHFRGDPTVRVVVVSTGAGADLVSVSAASFDNLVVLPFAESSDLPDVLGTADVLLTLLEPDAGAFSVPSKVLGQLCAARPQLASMPGDNAASGLIRSVGAGTVVEPGSTEGWLRAAEVMRADEALRERQGAAARLAAERRALDGSVDRIESVLSSAASLRRPPCADPTVSPGGQ